MMRLLSRLRLSAVVIVAVFGAAAAASAPVALAAASSVSVFPVPGARVAAPQTQITFRGVAPGAIGTVRVTGSRSGGHTGRILADSDGKGASFIPDHWFQAGETVRVQTGLNIIAAKNGSYSFQVGNPTGRLPILHWPAASRGSHDVQFYHSRKDLSPASVTISKRGAAGDGDIFVAPQSGPVQDGPMILDPNGNLVWFDAMHGNTSADGFMRQTYRGKPVLTWWQGTSVAGVGASGQDVIFDNTYRQIASVKAANGLNTDQHEFVITPHNTALITADYPVYWDTTSAFKPGFKRQIVLESVVQEIDIPTGLVLFQWDSLDHIPLSDTQQNHPSGPTTPFDAYHLNSIALDHDGNLIISSRETWAAYKVNHQTGAIMWTLGGKHSSFKLAPGTYWAYQHDVEPHSAADRVFSMFDNEGPPRVRSQSRAIRVLLDFKHMTATTITDEKHSPALASNFEGNLQQLGDGDFVGWGEQPYFTQFDKNGHVVFDGHLNSPTPIYRAFRFHWNATPWTTPAVVASTSNGKSYVFMSWNGATGVAGWRVWAGSSRTSLHYVMSVSKSAFESKAVIPSARYVQVQAVDAHHHPIRSSSVVPAP